MMHAKELTHFRKEICMRSKHQAIGHYGKHGYAMHTAFCVYSSTERYAASNYDCFQSLSNVSEYLITLQSQKNEIVVRCEQNECEGGYRFPTSQNMLIPQLGITDAASSIYY